MGVINQLTSGGHAVCWLDSIDACSIGKIISTLPDAARHRETREIQSVPVWVGFSEVPPEGMKLNTDSFWPIIIHDLDVSMGQSSSDYQISRLRTNFGGSLGVETKLWLKAWDWRRWMQVQPLVSDSHGLWVSKKFRPLRNHRSGLHEQPRPTRVYSWLSWHLPISCLHTFGSGQVFVPSAARSGAHEQPREAPFLAHEPRANQCERFTALNKSVHFKLFWTWHQPTPRAPLGALSNGVFWCDISRGFAAVVVFEMFWSSMNLTSDDWFVSRPSHPDLHENWCKRGKVIPASAKSQPAQKSSKINLWDRKSVV